MINDKVYILNENPRIIFNLEYNFVDCLTISCAECPFSYKHNKYNTSCDKYIIRLLIDKIKELQNGDKPNET